MNTDGIAVVALAVTSLAQTGAWLYMGHRVSDRVRVVSPPKQQQDKSAADKAAAPLRSAM